MLVDFHVHSTASDGTFSPSEIVTKAKGFSAIALTDHDNCDGVEDFGIVGRVRKVHNCLRVSGIELSIESGLGFDKFHLLGLGVDPGNAALKVFLKRILEGRRARNERIIANFRRLGIEMVEAAGHSDLPNIYSYAHGDVLARPHFARWLVEHGHAPDVKTAFERHLLPDSPKETRCYEERWHPPQEESFRVLHAAGGVCLMAHPKYWRRDWKTVGPDFAAAERGLAALREKGLDGLECLYQANTAEEDVGFTRIAERLGLLKSAGSDFHGGNKPAIPLGMEVSESFISPLVDVLASSRPRISARRS